MIRVITDYHAGLPAEILNRYHIARMASYVNLDGEHHEEGPDFTPDDFYRALASTNDFPETRPRTTDEFAASFTELLDDAKTDSLLYVAFSGEMSAMYDNASAAVDRFPAGAVTTFDTRSVSVCEGLMVRQAAHMAADGAKLDDILSKLEHMRDTCRLFFVVDTLDYLVKGGRIGRAAGLVGKVIQTKPVLTLSSGAVTSYARFNDREAALQNLTGLMRTVAAGRSGLQMGVAHAACRPDAEALADALEEELEPEVSFIGDVSPAVGAHAGPGSLALGWYVPKD